MNHSKSSTIVLLFLLFAGCNNSVQETTTIQPRVRAAFKSSGTGMIKVVVFVEGPDGNALSGTVVTVKDSHNSILQLHYDASVCSYNGVLEELPDETNYIVEASTILSNSIISLTIPYSTLANTPNVTIFQDVDGNSVLSGQPVSSDQPIQIGWADCGEDVVYQTTIKTALKTVYAVSSKACTVTVSAGVIPAGTYLLEIFAQKIHGDIYFRSFPYYSASSVTAPLVSCNVN